MTQALIDIFAVILTFMVLSRIIGDNPLFRVAQYLFVGISLGLAFVVAYHQVLRPAAGALIGGRPGAVALYGVPLLLGLLLLPRITRRQEWSWLANVPLALVFGVGAALAVGGAIAGTLAPQILDTANRPVSGGPAQVAGLIVLALGTIITLSAFYYTVPRERGAGRLVALTALVGHWLLMIAFGFFFADALRSYLTALTERLSFLLDWFRNLLSLLG
jgi:FtsH-binding integral membrane protein